MIAINALNVIVPGWDAPGTVKAITSTRAGGFSKQPYNEFNLAMHVDDEPIAVQRNRRLLRDKLRLPSDPVWLNQTHSTTVAQLSRRRSSAVVDADGGVTSDAAVVCAVMTADCLPLFLCNKQGSKVAAIHVGWRGLAEGIVEAAIAAMSESADAILAWAGPCISIEHFEVGQEVRDLIGGPESAYRRSAEVGKYYADLRELTGNRLRAMGVSDYGYADQCTYRDREQYFSYRRDRQTGRMVSLIWIEPQFRL